MVLSMATLLGPLMGSLMGPLTAIPMVTPTALRKDVQTSNHDPRGTTSRTMMLACSMAAVMADR